MSFRTDFLSVVDSIRAIAGPSGFDIRTSQLTIRTRIYTNGRRNSTDTYVDTDLVLAQFYKVRQMTTREIAGSGGAYELGDIVVGPITPSDGAGVGYTEAQLDPRTAVDGTEFIYVLTGAHAGKYNLKELRSTSAFHYTLVLTREETSP